MEMSVNHLEDEELESVHPVGPNADHRETGARVCPWLLLTQIAARVLVWTVSVIHTVVMSATLLPHNISFFSFTSPEL